VAPRAAAASITHTTGQDVLNPSAHKSEHELSETALGRDEPLTLSSFVINFCGNLPVTGLSP
jgi:hypothetical protein